jgi:uncharacterized protein YyaL (SSP411 family)
LNSQAKNPVSEAAGSSQSPTANRLIREKSPYLLLHAHNPVDWYPWGEEAFEKARREQKPILVSIGYYTCHWCHVMEQESFSNPSLAEILNRDFVSIKVDREERPDVDRIYMDFVQATTGSGGWPLNAFLTPDLKPFFGGTYWPPDDAHGRPGFRTILERVAKAWEKDRPSVLQAADRATEALQSFVEAPVGSAGELSSALLDRAYHQVKATYDERYGGFGGAPKFPRPVVFNLLLRTYARTGDRDALEMTLTTLRAMPRGGIHDQLGGGFHRYSTDARWFLPHFEKMLYDQAQLAASYIEAYQITHDPFYADCARDILDFVLREMRAPEGGFYSAQDADSLIEAGKPEHGEGAFYVWTQAEIESVLGHETAVVFDYVYGVEPSGNVSPDQDFREEFTGKNVLFERHTRSEAARHFGKSAEAVDKLLAEARQKLLEARAKRPHPPIDDKVVTAGNGLMISAFSRAAATLEEPRYRQAAEASARFIETRLYDPQTGRLRRRYRDGDSAIGGFLDDYAFLVQGLLDLYESSFDVQWLIWAVRLQEEQDRLFWDSRRGGYFATTSADTSILFRTREDYDGAEPSPNSVAAMNLLRLGEMTDRKAWREEAEKTLATFGPRLEQVPEAMPQMAAALDFSLSKILQIIIAGDAAAPDTRELQRLVSERYLPNKILLAADGGAGQKQIGAWLPFLAGVTRKDGKATAYICENYSCKLPTTDPKTVARLLDREPRP